MSNGKFIRGGAAVAERPEPKTTASVRSRGGSQLELQDLRGQVAAIGKSQAVIEFNLDGTIIKANENFLAAVGYQLDEIQGRHHKMFVDAAYASSAEYQQFWTRLNGGE